jgi:hypothetical protein
MEPGKFNFLFASVHDFMVVLNTYTDSDSLLSSP